MPEAPGVVRSGLNEDAPWSLAAPQMTKAHSWLLAGHAAPDVFRALK
jgi:hypothetical protein